MKSLDGLRVEDTERLHQHLRALAVGEAVPELTLSMVLEGQHRRVTLPASDQAGALRQQLVDVTYASSTVSLFSERLRERFRDAETSSDAQQWSFVLDAAQQSSTMLR